MISKTQRAALLAAAALIPAAAQAELVASWAMNGASGTVYDGSGSGLSATPGTSGLTYAQAGVPAGTYGAITLTSSAAAALGQSVNFTTGGAFSIAASPVVNNLLSSGTGNLTVMAWVKTTSLPSSTTYRIFATGPAGSNGWGFGVANVNRLRFTAMGKTDFTSTGTVDINSGWHHVALTVAGNTWTQYADGVAIGTGTIAGYNNSSAAAFAIGNSAKAGTDQFKGNIGQLRLYDTALTAAQIAGEATTAYLEMPTLTAASLAATPPAQAATLTLRQAGVLTAAQAAGFTAAQLALIPADRFGVFSPAIIAAITPSAASGLTAAQLVTFTAGQLGALTPAQVAALAPAAAAGFTPAQLRSLSAAQTGALTSAQLAAMSADQTDALAASAAAGTIASMTVTLYDTVTDGLVATTAVDLTGVSNTAYADGSGATRKTVDGLGKVSTATYDAAGNLLAQRDATGAGANFVYDGLGRRLSSSDASIAGKVTTSTYDAVNRLVTVTDPLGVVTTYGYDVRDRRTSESTPMSGSVVRLIQYGYDDNGNRTSLTDANGAVTTWTYDAANRQVTKTYANGDHRSMAYDALGRLVTLTDENGHDIASVYDLAGRLVARNYAVDTANGVPGDTFVYDASSRLLSATKGRYATTVAYTYDSAGRPATETQGWEGAVITRTYDAADRLASVALSATYYSPQLTHAEYAVAYGYDARGLLATVASGANTSTYAYRDNGQVASVVHRRTASPQSDILRTDRVYDTGARLTQVSNTAINGDQVGVVYTLGADDQRLTATEETGQKWAYGYDGLKQLVSANKTDTSAVTVLPLDQSYTYDPMGNRSAYTETGTSVAYTKNNANQYTGITTTGATSLSQAPTYDHNGNMLSDGVNTYVWDADNQLVSVTPVTGGTGKTAVQFTYDYLGRRVNKNSLGWNATTSTYDQSWHHHYFYQGYRPIYDWTDNGQGGVWTTKTYVWGNDLSGNLDGAGGVGGLLWMNAKTIQGSTVTDSSYAYAYDGNGNVRGIVKADAVTPTSSSFVEKYAYDGFGRELASSDPIVGAVNDIRFSTKALDQETGMNYYGLRYYASSEGRWINRDPILEEGGDNVYAMVNDDLINEIDVNGLEAEKGKCPLCDWELINNFKITEYNIANEKDYANATDLYRPNGLSRDFSKKFINDVLMQGSGYDKDGKPIQIDWKKSNTKKKIFYYTYVKQIKGASGRVITHGKSIAVDPSVIALGTDVCIDTIGERTADDTGGKIKGNHIDLFADVTHSEALQFGEKTLAVYKKKSKNVKSKNVK